MNATLILGFVLMAQPTPLSVSELLSNPDRFKGQPVTVSGTISNFRESIPRRSGRHYTFDLTDGREMVHVISFAEPPCRSGAVTVEGTFQHVQWRAKASYHLEEITAQKVICLPRAGRSEVWSGLKTGELRVSGVRTPFAPCPPRAGAGAAEHCQTVMRRKPCGKEPPSSLGRARGT